MHGLPNLKIYTMMFLPEPTLKRIPIKWVLQNCKREFTEVSVVLLRCTNELGKTINY